ncbi:MAG TPA: SPFH domain-containing protein [Candidatus Paceibacterota bacterium]
MLNSLFCGTLIWAFFVLIIGIFLGTGALGITLIVLSALLIGTGAILWRPIAADWVIKLAEQNKGFTFVNEGSMKFITLGGEVAGEIMQFEGKHLDGDGNIKDNNPGERYPGRYRMLFGAHWFENPLVNAKKIFGYDWRRSVVDEHGNIRELSGEVDYVPLARDVYWCEIKEAEAKDLVPLDIQLLLTVQIINPFKALFRTGARPGVWLQVIIARIAAESRNVVTYRSHDDWITHTDAMGDAFTKILQGWRYQGEKGEESLVETNEKDLFKVEFEEIYGVAIPELSVYRVDPSGNYRQLTTQRTEANIQAQVDIRRAEGKADALRTEAKGQADALKSVTEAMEGSSSGHLYQVLDTIRNSQPGAAVQAMFIPGFSDMLGSAMRGAETGNTAEVMDAIAKLTEQVEKLQANQAKPDENLEAVGEALHEVNEQLREGEEPVQPKEDNGYLC